MTDHVQTLGCQASTCVVKTCSENSYPCSTGCCAWEFIPALEASGLFQLGLAVDRDDRIHVAYTGGRYSVLGPSGWLTETFATDPAGDVAIAVGADNVPVVLYQTRRPDELVLARRAPSGWQVIARGASPADPNDIDATQLIIDASGGIHGFVRIDLSAGCFIAEDGRGVLTATRAGSPGASNLALTPTGTPTFHDYFGLVQPAVTRALVGLAGSRFSIGFEPSGTLVVAASGIDVTSATTSQRETATGWEREVIDPNVGSLPRLQLATDGTPHVVYGHEARYATRRSGVWASTDLPGTSEEIAFALDASGEPVVCRMTRFLTPETIRCQRRSP